MLTNNSSSLKVAILLVVLLLAQPLASIAQTTQLPQPLNIGVIGPANGPTAQGVILALLRFSAQGVFVTADGTSYALSVITADATTPQQVTEAIATLKKSNVVAIFGPDNDKLVMDSMNDLQAAGIPIFTDATSTEIKSGGLVFRTRAADNWRMNAMVAYLSTDLKKSRLAIYQGDDATAGAVQELVKSLTQFALAPSLIVTRNAAGTNAADAKQLLDNAPDAIIAFGGLGDTANLYHLLKMANYAGIYVTPNAALRGFMDAIPQGERAGIYGVTAWSYASDQPESADFLRDYVALFGNMPIGLSASAYDTAVALCIAIKSGGVTPDGIRSALLGLAKAKSLAGWFNPALGNNNLSASVTITVTNLYGAPEVVARYEDTGRVNVSNIEPTQYPTVTPTASPIPQGVVGTAKSLVNVRSGPGENYPVIGQLQRDEQQPIIGANESFSWYVINFRQQQGWVSSNFVTVFGDVRSLPLVTPPPSPVPTQPPPATAIPLASATPIAAQYADLVLVNTLLNPAIPTSGQPFTLVVTIQNQGTRDAGAFAVATSFLPGNIYSAVNVSGLAAGAQISLNINQTVTGSGDFGIAIVLDLNNQVDEGTAGEANNKPLFNYHVNP
jgi:ABC-type branched-subunit amino acid transport system substrate-binding protein